MAFVAPSYVTKMINLHKAVYWKITDRSKKLVINRQDKPISEDQSGELLLDTLDNCEGDYVVVTLYTYPPEKLKEGSTRGQIFELLVKLKNDFYTKEKSTGINGIGLTDYLALQEKIHKMEIDRIRDEANEKPGLIDKILENDKVTTLITALVSTMTKKPSETITGPSQEKNLGETLNRLKKLDPEIDHTLQKLAEYLEKNPGQLAVIKPIIGA